MKKIHITGVLIAIILCTLLFPNPSFSADKPVLTFIELGSVNCVPCKKMQKVMKNIENNYGDQIKVIFHDIYKEKDKVKKYEVKLIPTQIFFDKSGKEIFRHEGFFPESEIDELLAKHGLKKNHD